MLPRIRMAYNELGISLVRVAGRREASWLDVRVEAEGLVDGQDGDVILKRLLTAASRVSTAVVLVHNHASDLPFLCVYVFIICICVCETERQAK